MPRFIQKTDGEALTADDLEELDTEVSTHTAYKQKALDNANLLDKSTPGTLGWYYSENNNLEPYQATTDYPYSRTEYYTDGTGGTRQSGGVGEAFRLGSGREVTNFTGVVGTEMDFYLKLRKILVPGTPQQWKVPPAVSISRDGEGRTVYSISDAEGKTLATALEGSWLEGVNEMMLEAYEYHAPLLGKDPHYLPGQISFDNEVEISVYDNVAKALIYEGPSGGFTASYSLDATISSKQPFTVTYRLVGMGLDETSNIGQ